MGSGKVIFYEKQKITQWWFWLLIIAMAGFFAFALYMQFVKKQPLGNQPMGDLDLIISSGAVFIVVLLFLTFKLETKIDEKGISVRLFPLHLKWKQFNYEEISKCYVREYSPLKEYGGWGLRYGIFGNGKAYNIKGNKGLQLEFKNGKKLLIGTQKQQEVKKYLPI